MNIISMDISDEMIENAHKYQIFRNQVINILKNNNRYFDKFTVTNRDTFDGYLAEQAIYNYLKNKTNSILFWKRKIPSKLISKIQSNSEISELELIAIEDYFYDRYDFELCSTTRIDVKCAATSKEIDINKWTYGLPVVQMNKFGKDVVVLAYIKYNKDPKYNNDSKPIKCIIVGYVSICEIIKCNKSSQNTNANFDYQIENYETKLTQYKSLEDLIRKSCKLTQLKEV